MPDSTTQTYADIARAADGELRPWKDARTTERTFGVTARVLGIVTTYFLVGRIGDADATIIGRIEMQPGGRSNHYIGDRLKGGFWTGRDSFYVHLATAAGA